MKRFSILLVIPVLLLSFSFIVPASAAETDGNYFNVLDYTGLNNTPLTNVTFSGSTQLHFDLSSTYGSFNAYSVEFTYSYTGSTPSYNYFNLNDSNASTVKTDYIGNGIYRYRASFLGRSGSYFDIGLTSSGETSINVLAFNVYLTDSELFPLSGTVSAGSTSVNFSGGSGNPFNFGNSGSVIIKIDSWRNYDSLLFYLNLHAGPLESVSAVMFNNVDGSETPLNVDISPTFTNSGDTGYNLFIDVNLTSINRVSAPDSTLYLYLVFQPQSGGFMTLRSAYGSIFSDPPDPMTKWYQVLFFNIGNWFQNLENTVANGFESIEAKIDEVFGTSDFEQKKVEIDQSISDFDGAASSNEEYVGAFIQPDYIDTVLSAFPDNWNDSPIFARILTYIWNVPPLVIYVQIISIFIVFSAFVFGRRG